jgi:hypothetical protein
MCMTTHGASVADKSRACFTQSGNETPTCIYLLRVGRCVNSYRSPLIRTSPRRISILRG